MTKFHRYRIEIISNVSLELDILECMEKIEQELGEPIYYSKIENVYGKGKKGEKHGNGVWPEENFILIIYTSNKSIVNRLKDIVDDLNRSYPTEGINFFILKN
ncbi:PG0541 family transporter-associated protein [Borreliella garinii]|uniref:PG0541 family transporter-associated protein n=1 Tax=Borreliella garinii TaxID=29519 RepID=UPI001AEF1297|nr:PG0541 family transporter-associated protein [Borreliella garinii]